METEYEVKKLKDLVKKLERQNQHLRYKTGRLGPGQQGKLNEVFTPALSDCNTNSDELDTIKSNVQVHRLFTLSRDASEEFDGTLENWLRHDLVHPQSISFIKARNEIIKRLDVACNGKSSINARTSTKPQIDTLNGVATTGYDSQEEIGDGFHDQTKPSALIMPAVVVHHMPLPSHTMMSAHGLIKNAMHSTVSDELHNPLNSHYSIDGKVNQPNNRRSVLPSTRTLSSSVARNSSSGSQSPSTPLNHCILPKKDLHNVQLNKNLTERMSSGPIRDITPRGGRSIPTLSQTSPRRTKLTTGPDRRVPHNNLPTVIGEQSPRMVYNLGAGSHSDIVGKTGVMSPNRVPLPRPSRTAYSTPGSKHGNGRTSSRDHHQGVSETQSSHGDVWGDGEFF